MKIKIGLGNLITAAYDKTAKTVTFTGAYNWDIDPTSVEIYDNTIGAWILGNGAIGTYDIPNPNPPGPDISFTGAVKATITFPTTSTAHPLQVLQLNAVNPSSANGDTLSIYCECPDDVAIFNALVHILP